MFIRVISWKKDKDTEKEKMVTCLYECKRVHVRPGDDYDDNGEATEVLFVMEDPDVSILVDKKGTRVYIMNNEGRTIDSYVW